MFYFSSYTTSVNITLTFKKWLCLKWLYRHFHGKVQVFCKNVELHIVRPELQYYLSQLGVYGSRSWALIWAWAWAVAAHAHMSAHERERFFVYLNMQEISSNEPTLACVNTKIY